MSRQYHDINGTRFRRYPNAKSPSDRTYFHCITKNGKKLYAHRYVWELNNGPIPEGWHVHHVDKDTSNNSISNLEAMPASDHVSIHAAEPKNYESLKERMDNARPFASAWHKSDIGRAKHREIGFVAWQTFEPKEMCCDHCGSTFMSRNINRIERFCTNACKSAARRMSGVDNVIRTCQCCGVEFSVDKYKKTECCGRSCTMVMRHRRK